MLALTFLVGGAAACGDDDDKKADDSSETTAADDGGDEGGGGNEAITEYCDAVEDLVTKTNELADDPTNADLTSEITALTTEVTEKATALAADAANFDADDQAAYQECQDSFASAGAGG
ncbi:MAG TPA: hypothetical protein VK507_20345 [Iamia sp.]|nr:hypothetical protein [Iamia sp.]